MATETLRGVVRRVFFSDAESPFMAGVLALEDGCTSPSSGKNAKSGEARFSGKLCAAVGDRVELTGEWGKHPKYGPQFDAQTGIVQMDESPDALAHLLATDGRFKGLGPVRARKVVDAAMALSEDGDIASALSTYADAIATRAGVQLEIVENAAEVWNEKRSYFDALAALCGQGWSNAQAQTIMNRFGEGAPQIVKRDPYMLIGKIARFGFRTVDAVARQMGMPSTAPMRLTAGIAYCLDRIADDGNTWTTREGVISEAIQELRPDTLDAEIKIEQALDEMIASGEVYVSTSPLNGTEIVADARLASVEFDVFERLLEGLGDASVKPLVLDAEHSQIVETLNLAQRMALLGFSARRFGVVSGAAGTGKSYMMSAVCDVAERSGLEVFLSAPTGKAARRLEEATGRTAMTIHRLLDPTFDEQLGAFRFRMHAGNRIAKGGLVIVDEVSMVDVRLFRSLLTALHPTARLLLVGDHHQIPSVGPGAVLRDMLAARKRYPEAVHVLTDVVRQAGVLERNTRAILDGLVTVRESPEWAIQKVERGHEEGAAALAATLVEFLTTTPNLPPFGRELDMARDVQVLAPMKKGPMGTFALNVHLQQLRQRMLGNPPPPQCEPNKPPKPLPGDKIIWIVNDYELELFNGTQGIVLGFGKEGSMHLLIEDGREVVVPSAKRKHVDVSYAMTIHKAQGSGWPCVILVISAAHWIMRDRNLLYTGASRASKSLTILGDMTGINGFAKEQKSFGRQTFGSYIVHGWRAVRTETMQEWARREAVRLQNDGEEQRKRRERIDAIRRGDVSYEYES